MSRYNADGEPRRPPRRSSFDWRMPSLVASRSDSHELRRARPSRVGAYDDFVHRHTAYPPPVVEPGRSHPHRVRSRFRDRLSDLPPPSYLVPNPTPIIAAKYPANLPQSSYDDAPPHRPGLYAEPSSIEPDAYVGTVDVEERARRARRPSSPPLPRRQTDQEGYESPPDGYIVERQDYATNTGRVYVSRSRSLSRSRSPSLARNRRRPARADLEIIDMYDDFEFDFQSAEPFKNGDTSDLETPSLDASTAALDEKPTIQGSNATGIYSARYNGTAELGARHEALLTSLHNSKGLAKPLFRWLHIQQDVMNFDEFWVELSRNVYFSDKERGVIGRLRAEIKRQCIKSRRNAKGVKVGYMEPRLMEVTIEKADKEGDAGKDEQEPLARWICLPYFVLQKYGGLLEGSSLSAFPSQTLLQAQYSRSTQQRDMSQAVCSLGTAEKGECFHIAQVWYLVLDDTLLVSCGTMSKKKLQADVVKVTSEPPPTGLGGASMRRIIVKYTESVKWIFTPEECPTWFDFISHFLAFWPTALEFKRNNIGVTAKDWPKLLRYLSNSRHDSVTLTMTMIALPAPPPRILRGQDSAKEATDSVPTGDATTMESPRSPALLELMNPKTSQTAKSATDGDELTTRLSSAEKFLREETPFATQDAYELCDEVPRRKVVILLEAESARIEDQKDDDARRRHEQNVALFNMADSLFQIFLSIDCEGATVKKFWGAVMALCTATHSSNAFRRTIENLTTDMESLWPLIRTFEGIFGFMSNEKRENVVPTREFVTAWLHILSVFILCAASSREWENHFMRVRRLLADGMDKVIQSISTHELLSSCTVLPLEVASLTALQLLQDQVGSADDVSETYSQYLNSLDTEITTQQSDRSPQHRIDLVRQEMTVIRRTVGQQRHMIASLRKTVHPSAMFELYQAVDDEIGGRRAHNLNRHRHGDVEVTRDAYGRDDRFDDRFLNALEKESKLSPTQSNGFRGLFLNDCAQLLEQRAYEFRRYAEYADDLERAVGYKMDFAKDRQESAVYAFTMVTAVFLPLSAISGIFGMNTSDIRDMPYRQWLYWVVALPVTIATLLIGLWWMDELGNVYRWLTGKQANVGEPHSGYATFVVPEDDGYYSDEVEGKARPSRQRMQRMQEYIIPDASRRERYRLVDAPTLAKRGSVRRRPTVVRY